MKKNIIWAVICSMALLSCQREQDFQQAEGAFRATIEGPSTKTVLSPNGETSDVLWRKGDQITIEDGAGHAGIYSTESTGNQGVFAFKSGAEAVSPSYKAWFPASLYQEGALALPATQNFVLGNINTAPMFASSETKDLAFKNLCGIVRLCISTSQEGQKVRKIILSADKGLSGPFSVTEHAAVVSGTDGVTLDCGEEGVEIGEEAVQFHIAVPAGTYHPFKITVITTDGCVQTRVSSADIVIERYKICTISLGFGEISAISGSADVLSGSKQPWVQLWPGGPKWAKFNVGSAIDSWAGITDYTHPDVVGGYYSIKGRYDSVPDGNKTDDTAAFVWGGNWATPTRDQFQALMENCDWTFCDGETVQYEAGCTLKGWKVAGKEAGFDANSIFLPLCGARDQNTKGRAQMGSRGLYWTNGTGNRYFLELFANSKGLPYHDPNHGCSVRAICVGDKTIVPGQFELYQSNVNTVPEQFNAYTGENPKMLVMEDITSAFTITRSDGEIDLQGHSGNLVYFQNNDPEKTLTIKNGTLTKGLDGKDGQSDYYGGKVVLENITVGDCIWVDGHDLTIKSGTYNRIEHKKNAATPGKLTILDGCFGEVYRYVDKYGGADDGSTIALSGGKFKVKPAQKWCADGHYATANTDADKETYPYKVVEGDPSANWFNGTAVDLSAQATANTYMVHQAGTYKFKATVKGNGGFDPIAGATATPINAADIRGVKILWELKSAGLAIKYEDEFYQIAYKDGYVYFNTPDTFVPGDAYVAVFNDAGEILWSWLIWATEKPSQTQKDDVTIMDRNIGALSVSGETYSAGFNYQWGRKDPFPAGTVYNRGTQYTYVPAVSAAFGYEADNNGFTMAHSVAHPATQLGPASANWLVESEFTTELWYSGSGKTIYDPCPAGWKVPSKDELASVFSSGVTLPGGGSTAGDSHFNSYCNGGSQYYWSSTAIDRANAWSCQGGTLRTANGSGYPDWRLSSAMSIRPVKDVATIDLSQEQSANCYLVPEEGKYKFKATLKGNGAADHSGISKDTDPASIAKAELVWATFNTITAPAEGELIKDISYADGYVTFSTGSPYKEGNALVAIKDASDNILWSWHLWFESDDMVAKAQTYPASNCVMMDRNLGALTNCYDADNALDFGFTYQNGRKDPFMTSATRTTYTALGVLGTYTSSEGGSNVANSILKPTVVFGYDGWGGNQVQWAPAKTIFDPCPPGWHIPPFGFANQWSLYRVPDNDWSKYHGYIYNEEAWFPATGDRWGPNHNNTGSLVRLWGGGSGAAVAAGNGNPPGSDGSNPGHGYSVRCVKE